MHIQINLKVVFSLWEYKDKTLVRIISVYITVYLIQKPYKVFHCYKIHYNSENTPDTTKEQESSSCQVITIFIFEDFF